jgi:hypothetical protein
VEKFTITGYLRSAIAVLFALTLAGCANQMPPPGGEVDKIPPEVVEMIPQNGSTNYRENYVEFTFSEYVDKRSVQDAFFMSPSQEGAIEFDWSGKSVEVIFEDSLRENTTYIITIGTEVKDLNNGNNMASSLNLTFSTGNEIDYCSVEGKIYDKKSLGTMIFAYMLGDTIPDPAVQKPEYLTQAGDDGNFKLLGMAPANYRIFAVKDEFKNLVYNVGEDRYGAPFRDVLLTKQDSLFTGLNFQLTIEDTLKPQLSSVTMTDEHHFLVEFSERIDSSRISPANFSIYDSTSNKKIEINYLYKGKSSGLEYFLSNKDTLAEGNSHSLIVENIFDKSGNKLERESLDFVVSTAVDTIPPSLKNVITEFEQGKMDFVNPYIILRFNDAFEFDSVFDAFKITDPKDQPVRYKLQSVDASTVKIIPESLDDDTEYSVDINLNKFIDAAGNRLDSTHTINVSTMGEIEFSGVTGVLNYSDTLYDKILVLENLSDSKRIYKQIISSGNQYGFERVVPGKYFIWSFIDSDKDTTFDYGSINPFRYSERFVYYPDTLNLRARWPVGDINFRFPE